MATVTEIPTQEEYQKVLDKINSKYQKAQKEFNAQYQRNMVKNQMSSCPGMSGWRAKGLTECDAWKMDSRNNWNNNLKPKLQGQIDSAKKELTEYQTAVSKLQREKSQAELNAELARQQKIIEDNIRETFRIETEKMQAASKALTKERQQKIIPPPPPVIETPKNEPLAILSDMDRLQNYVNTTPQTTIQESKINYSALAIIGAIGIVSILLVRRFA